MKPTLSLGLCVALSLIAAIAQAAPGTLLRDENLRAHPSATAMATAQVGRGTAVEIVSRRGGWLQIRTGRTQGWVRLLSVRAGQGGAGGAGLRDMVGVATRRADPSRVVSVAGVRGLSEDQLRQARFDADELARLDNYSVTPSQARVHASKSGLAAVSVAPLPRPQPAYDSSGAQTSDWPN